jgi:hypothetical protein
MRILAPDFDKWGVGFKVVFQDGVNLNLPRVASAFGVITANNQLRPHASRRDHIALEQGAGFIDSGSGIEADTEQSAIALLDKTLTKQQGYFFRFQYFRLAESVDFHIFKSTLGYYTFLAYQPQRQVFRPAPLKIRKSYRWIFGER